MAAIVGVREQTGDDEAEGLVSFEDAVLYEKEPSSGIISQEIRKRIAITRKPAVTRRPLSADAERLRSNLDAYRYVKCLENLWNAHPVYKVFTTAHDEVVTPEELANNDELLGLRVSLDDARQNDWHNRASAYDHLSGALATNLREVFNIHPVAPRDTAVTLLMDHSGAQLGDAIRATAMLTEILAAKLDILGVRTEILGHTTRAFQGGVSRQDWLGAGKPPQPGRLNDMRYIVYKDVRQDWKDAGKNLGLMLKDYVLKENIDGEAMQWGAERLAKIPAKRRLLVYIGKMRPLDDSTMSVNEEGLLEGHVRSVVKQITAAGQIELRGIHIGRQKPMNLFSRYVDAGGWGEMLLARPEEGARRLSNLFMGYGN